MKLKLEHLVRWNGELSRVPFLLWAAILFAVKYNIDRLLLKAAFGADWWMYSYFYAPLPWLNGLRPTENPGAFALLIAVTIPFLWIGIVLCLKRLRSARLPLWLAVLFVVPVLKWFLFAALAIVPDRREDLCENVVGRKISRHAKWFPKSRFGTAFIAVCAGVVFALFAGAIATYGLREYGWALFAGIPFSMGFFAAITYAATQPRRLGESITVSMLSVLLAGAAMLAFAWEGLICIIMAVPLAFPLALIGALAGHAVQASRWNRATPQLHCVPILAVSLMLGSEKLRNESPPLLKVVTAIEVNASPEQVWKHVVEFSELPPPTETIFKIGIAYPIRAKIQGHGVGAVRDCVFSTGPFVEPIEVWDEPRLLKFSVTQNPEPMQEWTPYRSVHPPHLNGFMVSEQGQFLLTPLPGGRTRLEGTTWYHHGLWPAPYWQIWSDSIIHTIHNRVLKHIKNLAEAEH